MASAADCEERRRAHFTYIWTIKSAPDDATLKSPVFTVSSMEMTKWKLILGIWPVEGVTESIQFTLRFMRNEEDDGPESIEVDFELAFLDPSESSSFEYSGSGHFRKETLSEKYKFSNEVLSDKRGGWLFPKDPTTIRCRLWRKGTEISKSELCFASTRFDSYHDSFVWAIKRFNSLQLGEKRERVVDFGCGQLILAFSLGEANQYSVVIHLETSLKNPFFIYSEIALLNAEGVVSRKFLYDTYIDTGRRNIALCCFDKTTADAFLFDDVLILRCDFLLISVSPLWSRIDDYKFMNYSNSITVQKEKRTNFDETTEAAVCPFKEIVSTFKEDGTLSDVSLRAGTKSFPVHKLILSSRSPVFRAMFTEDMREKTSKCIDMPDMDADTLGRLLSYIYEDKLQVPELTWDKAANLYEAADEYALLDLKEMCSSVLKSHISESNACKILVIADLHQDESLKKSVQQFMQNKPEIMKSDVWKAFRKEHSELAFETTEQIIFNINCSRS